MTKDPGGDVQPAISLDGKYIAFTSNRVGAVDQIFRMDMDGGNLKQLTQGTQKILASFGHDGKWIYCVEPSSNTVWKMPTTGGEPTSIVKTPDGWTLAGIDINSSDGRLVYGMSRRIEEGQQWRIGILPQKGEPKLIDLPPNFGAGRPRWAPDKRAITVLSEGNVWSISVDGKLKPRRITDFRTEGTADPRWTASGKQLFVSRGVWSSNPVLIQNTGN